MHKFGKLIGSQIKLFRNGCFICRLHVFVEIFNFTKGKCVNKNPKRNVAMFSHVMGYYLMMFTHLSSNFLLDISYKLNGGRYISLSGVIKILYFEIVVMTIFSRKFMRNYRLKSVFNFKKVF